MLKISASECNLTIFSQMFWTNANIETGHLFVKSFHRFCFDQYYSIDLFLYFYTQLKMTEIFTSFKGVSIVL